MKTVCTVRCFQVLSLIHLGLLSLLISTEHSMGCCVAPYQSPIHART